MVFADCETGSDTESSDDDSEVSDSPPAEKEETCCKQPRTWNEAYGQMQKLVLSEKFRSHATAKVRAGKAGRKGHGCDHLS
jgi:hypothetical protein